MNQMPDLERKSTLLEVKDIDAKQGIFIGYFSSFGVKDSYEDVVDFGAFAKTFAEWGPAGKQRIKCDYQHMPYTALLGKPLKLEERSYGAYHETKVSQTSYGKDVLLLIEDKVLTEQSFIYETIQAIPKSKSPDGCRHLTEVRLWSYGPVTWGANDQTPITGMKAEDIMGRMAKLDKHLRDGDLSDGNLIALMTRTMEMWGKALADLQTQAPEVKTGPETIHVQTAPPQAAPDAKQTGGDTAVETKGAEAKSMNGVWSFEETINHVWQVVRMIERIPYSDGDGTYARYYLYETYPTLALIEDNTTSKFYTMPWARNTEGEVVLGAEMTEVVKTWTPAQKAKAMASLLRVATTMELKAGPEAKAGRRNSTADAADIRMIVAKAAGLLDSTDKCAATGELLAPMTQDEVKSVMGSLDENQRAIVLAACQPEGEPDKAHSPTTTDGGKTGPDTHPETPDLSAKRQARARELELMEMEMKARNQ